MPGIDERVRAGLEALAPAIDPGDVDAIVHGVVVRKHRRRIVRRAQVVALTAAVIAGILAGVLGLMRAFEGTRPPVPGSRTPRPSAHVTVSSVSLFGENDLPSRTITRIEKVYGVLTNHGPGWSRASVSCLLRDAAGTVVWRSGRSGAFLLAPGARRRLFLASGQYSGRGAAAATCSVTATPASPPAPRPRPTFPPGEAVAPGFQPAAVAFWNARDGLIGGGLARGAAVKTCPGCRGVIAATHDGGRTWHIVERTRAAVEELDVAPGTPDAWAVLVSPQGGPAGILRTTDAGRSWSTLRGTEIGLSFPTPTDGWALPASGPPTGIPGKAALAHTLDGGRTWTTVDVPCPRFVGTATAVAFATGTDGLLVCTGEPGAGSQSKAILATSDGGRTWHVEAEVLGFGTPTAPSGGLSSGGYLGGAALLPDGRGWAWGGRSPLLATSDGGRTWRVLPLAILNGAMGGPSGVSRVSDANGFVLTWNPNVAGSAISLLATSDGGQTWSVVRSWPVTP